MKNAKIWIALIALVAVMGLMAGLYFGTREKPENPDNNTDGGSQATEATFAKTFTLTVVHANGEEKTFTVGTNRTYVSEALLDEKLIVESDSPGMYTTVDGETADYNVDGGWWKFIIDGQDALEGMNTTAIRDGAVYKLVYTVGW